MIRYIRTVLLAFLALTAAKTYGQNMESAHFDTDTRTAGLAGAGVAIDANAQSVFRNLAGVNFSEYEFQAAYTYQQRNGKNSFHSLGGYYQFDKTNAVAFGVRYSLMDEIEMTDNGVDYTTFRPYDLMIDVGYARRMTDAFSLSLNLRYVASEMSNYAGTDDTATGVAIDLGGHYRKEWYSLAATLSNLGTLMNYGGDDFRMPARVKLGGAAWWDFQPEHRLTGSLEGRYNFMPAREQYFSAAIGAEYSYKNRVAVRGGYHTGEKNKSMGNYATVGCGIALGPVVADFAYTFADSDKSIMDKVWMITAGVRF